MVNRDHPHPTLKIALSACLGIIATGGAAWFTLGANAMSREDADRAHAPIIEDVRENEEDIGKLTENVNRLVTEQRVLVEKLDHLAEQR